MKQERVRVLKKGSERQGPIAYWMSRDQRVRDNWALLYAEECARERHMPLAVFFCLVPEFLGATIRQYGFMLKGLQQVEQELARKNIAFYLIVGQPETVVPQFIVQHKIGMLITDFDPLRIKRTWKEKVAQKITIPFDEVDAHNIVPCWLASPKLEYGAYTIRPKIKRLLPQYLTDFPQLKKHPFGWSGKRPGHTWNDVAARLKVNCTVREVSSFEPGEQAAKRVLNDFIKNRLGQYESDRNDPTKAGQSGLSPYLHFGQIAAQRVALTVEECTAKRSAREAFLEELIVRRELSDNYCFYNKDYDTLKGCPEWAQATVHKHTRDKRTYVYSTKQLEQAETHDELWNAAQMEMVKKGKMHGYLRMYWAKKILEWTSSPEEAMHSGIYLNDKYELDGRDPNGYVGVAWSVAGVHDRAWSERPIFGKIRYMSYNGCKSKFDVRQYINYVARL